MNVSLKKIKIDVALVCKIILFYCIIMQLMIDMFRLPSFIKYFVDGMLIISFLLIKQFRLRIKHFHKVFIFILIYIIVCCVSLILNIENILLFLWATRNTFRGIIYFILLIEYLEITDLKKIFSKLYYVQFVSLILALYQFFVLHHNQDDIGGIFGYGDGASLNAFNIMMISYYLYSYFHKEEKLIKLIVTLFIAFVISALAEEKMTFLFLGVLYVLFIIFSSIKISKKFYAMFLASSALLVGLIILKNIYPGMYDVMINVENLFKYSQITFDEGYRLPRLGSFRIISAVFFDNELFYKMFGIGFGNSETASFSFLQSSFYKMYGSYNYRWFSSQWIFIEQGYIGFVSYFLIFVSMFLTMVKSIKKYKYNKNFIFVGLVMSFYAIASIWYNATLKTDASYLLYFSIAVGFISCKSNQRGVNNG